MLDGRAVAREKKSYGYQKHFQVFGQDNNMVLYKYIDERGIDTLLKLRIKVTPPIYLNDPFEFSFTPLEEDYYQHFIQTFRDRKSTEEYFNSTMTRKVCSRFLDIVERECQTNKEIFINSFSEIVTNAMLNKGTGGMLPIFSRDWGVFCTSKTYDNILMWSHYTNSHKGLVIGFSFNVIKEYASDFAVIYSDRRPQMPFTRDLNSEEMHSLFFTKSKHWKYEKEYRLIFPLSKCDTEKDKNSGKEYYYLDVDSKNIVQVFAGCRMSDESFYKIREILSDPKYKMTKLYKMKQDHYRYKLIKYKV